MWIAYSDKGKPCLVFDKNCVSGKLVLTNAVSDKNLCSFISVNPNCGWAFLVKTDISLTNPGLSQAFLNLFLMASLVIGRTPIGEKDWTIFLHEINGRISSWTSFCSNIFISNSLFSCFSPVYIMPSQISCPDEINRYNSFQFINPPGIFQHTLFKMSSFISFLDRNANVKKTCIRLYTEPRRRLPALLNGYKDRRGLHSRYADIT